MSSQAGTHRARSAGPACGPGRFKARKSTIYVQVPPTTPTLMSRVRSLPPSGRSRSTIPDDSRRSPMLNLRYQELGQCATWIKGSTDNAFYPRILPNCHGSGPAVVTLTQADVHRETDQLCRHRGSTAADAGKATTRGPGPLGNRRNDPACRWLFSGRAKL